MSSVLVIGRGEVKIKDAIGHGGYSTVFKGKWKTRPIAIKRLNRPDGNELEILSKLKHPNIASLLGVVDQPPDYFLILELCEGGSLREYLDKKSNIPVHELVCLCWGEQAGRAIEYLHDSGVIHRDVKSSNYLVTNLRSKNLKLCDFGISKTSAKTVTTEIKGTFAWTAPEAFSEEHISPKSDIFSYGTVLWEILTGKIPFPGVEYPNIMYRIVEKKERPLIPIDCPEEISTLLHLCWKEDRRERPDAAEVVRILRAYRLKVQDKYVNDGDDLQYILPYTTINGQVDGSNVQLKVTHGAIIDDMKRLLPRDLRVSNAELKAYFNDQELEIHRTLYDYRIDEGVSVIFKQRLRIRSNNGDILQLHVSPKQTVADLKHTIHQLTGTPSDSQILIGRNTLVSIIRQFNKRRFSAEILDKDQMIQRLQGAAASDSHRLWEYDSNTGSDDVLCQVNTHSVHELHELRGWSPYRTHLVVPTLTVNDLKDIFGLVNYDLPLEFRGQSLDDVKTLAFYGINYECTIEYRYWKTK